jgi:chaperonin GroEL (HSP60 family)
VQVGSAQSFVDTLTFASKRRIENVLSILIQVPDLALLICTQQLPDPIPSVLKSKGVSAIQSVAPEVVQRVCALAGVAAVTEFSSPNNLSSHAFKTNFSECKLGASSFGVLLEDIKPLTHDVAVARLQPQCGQLLVRAPIVALGEQYSRAIGRTLRMLLRWLSDEHERVVAGGCASEFSMYTYFRKRAREARGTCLQNPSMVPDAYSLLAECMLTVPLALLKNFKPIAWESKALDLLSRRDSGSLVPIILARLDEHDMLTSPLQLCSPDELGGIIEPLACKLEQLSAMLDIFAHILRIDGVVKHT